MDMYITDLPGVGKKISFINAENQLMAIIIHHTGKRELFFFKDADDDEAVFSFRLSSEDTKQVATQLLGATFSPEENEKLKKINMVRKQVVVEWIDLAKHSPIVGLKVSELKQRLPRGASIIGVFRNDDFVVDFETDLLLEINDTLMVVGQKDALVEVEQMCAGKGN
ncbi:TrkA domain protein [Evansella caseinilytica]|uniref:TrkA domain protein n=1 Tax=Evansella caseinilytica TaxID=1503961 RepID=A0A1H3SW97_9BACI|nr:TrkA C-terminal domain-containing protein [Evansella caseinilytica]SDZ41821.1 TrkA domain protein [Evansella caseinilytica]